MSRTKLANAEAKLTEKQRMIFEYLNRHTDGCSYFKSRRIAKDIGLTAREVGTNMPAIIEGDVPITVERWGYSSSTTWKVSV